jgi:hypothetical protein
LKASIGAKQTEAGVFLMAGAVETGFYLSQFIGCQTRQQQLL